MLLSCSLLLRLSSHTPFFFFNNTATTEIYTLSLHDALPICDDDALDAVLDLVARAQILRQRGEIEPERLLRLGDRKSTRLNSSHANISYAVFCLKKKTSQHRPTTPFQSHRKLCHSSQATSSK